MDFKWVEPQRCWRGHSAAVRLPLELVQLWLKHGVGSRCHFLTLGILATSWPVVYGWIPPAVWGVKKVVDKPAYSLNPISSITGTLTHVHEIEQSERTINMSIMYPITDCLLAGTAE
jgi:hypothetical protein